MRHQSAAARPWERHLVLMAVIFTAAISRGDTISTQVACSVPGQSGVIAVGSCSQQDSSYNSAQESITTSIVHPGSSSDYFTFQLTDTGTALAQGGNLGPDSVATSSANVDISLKTVGPERSGYIEIVPTINADAQYSSPSLSFSIGALQGTCGNLLSNCYMSSPGVNYPDFPRMYAFTLGDPFSFDLNYWDMLDAVYEDGRADTLVDFTLQFRFFESDGVTPAVLNPEPATWALACMGVPAAFLLGRRRRNPEPN